MMMSPVSLRQLGRSSDDQRTIRGTGDIVNSVFEVNLRLARMISMLNRNEQ